MHGTAPAVRCSIKNVSCLYSSGYALHCTPSPEKNHMKESYQAIPVPKGWKTLGNLWTKFVTTNFAHDISAITTC